MATCPACGSPEVVILQTRRRFDGAVWRSGRCTSCMCRWCGIDPAEGWMPRLPLVKRSNYQSRRLTDRQAAYILLSPESARAMAERFSITYQSVLAIRAGTSYRNVYEIIALLQKD